MVNSTFFNIATSNVVAARKFYSNCGFEINEEYSNDEVGICVVINDNTNMMVLSESHFEQITHRNCMSNIDESEVYISFQLEGTVDVDQRMENVLLSGGTEIGKATSMNSMYYRSFTDLDGHHFEFFCFTN